MLYAIRAFSVLRCIALAGDGHLQLSTSPSESEAQSIIPLQILIIIRVVLGLSLLSSVFKMFKSNKALAVTLKQSRDSSLYSILKQDSEPAVSETDILRSQKTKDEVKQELSTVYQRPNLLETELRILQDGHALEVTSLKSTVGKARALRLRSMGKKFHKGRRTGGNVIRHFLQIERRALKASHSAVSALSSRNEELELMVYHLRIGICKLASGALEHSGSSLALDGFAFSKIDFENTAASGNFVDTSISGLSLPLEATPLAPPTYVGAESESQMNVTGRYLTPSLDQILEDSARPESEDRSLDEVPTPAILSRSFLDEWTEASALGALSKDRSSYGALSTLPGNAEICLAKSSTHYVCIRPKDVLEGPFTNVCSDDETTEANGLINFRPSSQFLHSSPTVLFSGYNELTSVGTGISTSQQWDTGCVKETIHTCAEVEALSSDTRPDSRLVEAVGEAIVENSEADTTSSFVDSSSTHELDSLCDSNIASMLSRYFKEESSVNAPRAERPPEDWLCDEYHSKLLPSAADINANFMQDLSSKGPITHPYSSVSTMIGLGIRSLRPIVRKGDKSFGYLSSNYTSKSLESQVPACASKGSQKATPKVARNNRKALANIENSEIEYIE